MKRRECSRTNQEFKNESCIFAYAAVGRPGRLFSADFNNDYLEAGVFHGEINGVGLGFEGVDVRGSKAFGNWLVFGDFERNAFEPLLVAGLFRFESDSDFLRVGGGYAWPVHDRIDLVSGAGLVRASIHTAVIDLSNGSNVSVIPEPSDNGYFAVVGVRGRFTERLEGEFRHRFTNVLTDRANDWRIDIRYAFTPAFSAGLGYRDFEGDAASAGTLRWSF